MTRRLLLMGRPWDGYGDALQASRYLPEVTRALGPFDTVVAPNMVRLFGRLGVPITPLVEGSALAHMLTRRPNEHREMFILTMSPMRACLTKVGVGTVWTAPPEPPPPAPMWADMSIRHSYRVGLCTSGRGIPIDAIRRLLEIPAAWLGLDIDPAPYMIDARLPTLAALGVRDWADTAGVLLQLDLVITADTGLAHLAGTLGIPTLTLLPETACARWGVQGAATTPWYPSMRLFRCQAPADWTGCVQQVQDALVQFLIGKAA